MSYDKKLQKEAMHMLKLTSRTFYIPITLLESTLKKTVGSAYLCMRAIDEIEDHEELESETKQWLLRETGTLLDGEFNNEDYLKLVEPYKQTLPEVTLRLGDWLSTCPSEIKPNVQASTSEMAFGMAKWAEKGWHIENKEDLDDYTYYVAGLVGALLSEIWDWRDGTKTDRELAIGYGRGLQAVNILRNQDEDKERGVSFIPNGWTIDDLFDYADMNLELGDKYVEGIQNRSVILFSKIPHALAKKTLKALKEGREKMTRAEVEATVEEIKSNHP